MSKKWLTYPYHRENVLSALAVYQPILGRYLDIYTADDICQASYTWMTSVERLANKDYKLFRDRKQTLKCKYCAPDLIYNTERSDKKRIYCNKVMICPHCYSRRLRDLYKRMSLYSLNIKSKKYRISYVKVRSTIKYSDSSLPESISLLTSWRKQFISDIRPLGCICNFDISPPYNKLAKIESWITSKAAVFIHESDWEPSLDIEYKVKGNYSFSPFGISKCLQQTHRYPPGLLLGDDTKAIDVIDVRSRSRMSFTYGLFRKMEVEYVRRTV